MASRTRNPWRGAQAARRLLLAAACFGGAAGAPAAPPAALDVPDTIAQRVMACAACHGPKGVASNQGYFPRIAGKPAGYLYNQLLNFREGRRHNPAMIALVENMTEAYLLEIATHFASLDLPYPPAGAMAAPVPAAMLARGSRLVHQGDAASQLPACAACHGAAMTGASPAIPGLLGLPKDYLLAQFGAWRSGQRRAAPPDCMAEIGRRLSARDLDAVASYLALQPVPHDARPAAAVAQPLPLACGSVPP